MLAFHDDPALKTFALAFARAQRGSSSLADLPYPADWAAERVNAVTRAIGTNDFSAYESELGIPVGLATIEEFLFFRLTPTRAATWQTEYLSHIQPGTDLSRVHWALLHSLMVDKSYNPAVDNPDVADTVRKCTIVMESIIEGRIHFCDATAAELAVEAALDTIASLSRFENDGADADRAVFSATWAMRAVWRAGVILPDGSTDRALSAVYATHAVRVLQIADHDPVADRLLFLLAHAPSGQQLGISVTGYPVA